MDRAYEDDQTRQLALEFGWIPVAPPKRNRLASICSAGFFLRRRLLVHCNGLFPGVRVPDMGGEELDDAAFGGCGVRQQGREPCGAARLHWLCGGGAAG